MRHRDLRLLIRSIHFLRWRGPRNCENLGSMSTEPSKPTSDVSSTPGVGKPPAGPSRQEQILSDSQYEILVRLLGYGCSVTEAAKYLSTTPEDITFELRRLNLQSLAEIKSGRDKRVPRDDDSER